MAKPIRSFLGYYKISLPAEHAAKILNTLKSKNIFFFAPKPDKNTVTLCSGLFSASKLIGTVEKMGYTAEISSRHGLPFVLERYKSRYGIYLGIILGCMLLLFSTMRIWSVEITGNVTVPEQEIRAVLYKHGLGEGTFIPKIKAKILAHEILLDYRKLSSMAINVNGTVVTVDVIERTSKTEPEFKDDGIYNLISDFDGIITNVQAHEGAPEVKVGQVVTKGQLLVNGFVKNRYGAYKAVAAKGYVYADVTENKTVEVPFVKQGKKYTGRQDTKTEIYFIGYPIKLYKSPYPEYEYYDAWGSEEYLTVFNLKLPIKISRTNYKEYTLEEYTLSKEQAKTEAEKRFDLWIQNECEGEIVSITLAGEEKNNSYLLSARVVVNRNIAIRKEILFTYPNKQP